MPVVSLDNDRDGGCDVVADCTCGVGISGAPLLGRGIVFRFSLFFALINILSQRS